MRRAIIFGQINLFLTEGKIVGSDFAERLFQFFAILWCDVAH